MISSLSNARSFLFVPGDRPERFGKALQSGADAVVLDLEDAVSFTTKALAREAIATAWAGFGPAQRARVVIRINPAATPWHTEDVALLAHLSGLPAVMLAKAENAEPLQHLARHCPGLAVIPLVESAAGFAALDSLAKAPQVLRLALGHIDLQADLGMRCGPEEHELAPARWAMVCASRNAGLPGPIDGVTTDLKNPTLLVRDTQRSQRSGFTAKLCIHPAQVAAVHQTFAPTQDECAWAKRVLDGSAQAQGAVFSVDGKMVDAPVVLLAEQIMARVHREPDNGSEQ